MKFKKHNDMTGVCLQGTVCTTYERLARIFGAAKRSNLDSDGKITALWILKAEDGTVATIYDWKTGVDPWNNTHWNIGGFDGEDTATKVADAIFR